MKIQSFNTQSGGHVHADAGGIGRLDVASRGAPERRETRPFIEANMGGATAAQSQSDHGLPGVPLAYAHTPNGPLHADPVTRGVYRSDDGHAHIRLGDQVYPVRYDKDNSTWRAVSPGNPTKYAYPVRQNDSGNWQAHGDVGMPGGLKGDALAVVNRVQHEIATHERHIDQLTNRLQQLPQQWNQLQSELHSRWQAGAEENLPPFQALRIVSEGMDLHNQKMGVQQQLEQKKEQVRQLRQSLHIGNH